MDYKSIEKRLTAAHAILHADTIDRSAFGSLKTLLSGVHPKVDKILGESGKAFKHMDQIQKGAVIELIAEGLPDTTPEEKKRKKALLLFLKFWKDLKSEVARIEKELTEAKTHGQKPMHAMGKVFSTLKGPLGIITLVAVGVAMLKVSEVSVTIKNQGCEPMRPQTSVSINIPGLRLLGETIPDGGEAVAKLPPLTATVDATSANFVRLTMYGITYDFALGSSGIQLDFDGQTLNGKTTTINLGSQKAHALTVSCR